MVIVGVTSSPLFEQDLPSGLISFSSTSNLTGSSSIHLSETEPCPLELVTERVDIHGVTLYIQRGPALDPQKLRNLLQYSLAQIDRDIEAHGESSSDPSGYYYYTVGQGLTLAIHVDDSVIPPRLDRGRVGDAIEGLIKYNIDQRRFCFILWFDITLYNWNGGRPRYERIGRGRLMTN